MPKSNKEKDALEVRILRAKAEMYEAGAKMALPMIGFIPHLIKRIIEEFEKDFKAPFYADKISMPPSPTGGGSGGHIASVPFNIEKFEKGPCYLCGRVLGLDYFKDDKHPCAALYHKAVDDGD
jgi:acetamidase/formamidase